MRVAHKLVGVPTIGGGECPGRGWWWRESKESNTPPCRPECMKTTKKLTVSRTFWLLNHWNSVFRSKVLNKIYSRDGFLRNTIILNYSLLRSLWSYICSKFRKSYMPQPPGLGLRLITHKNRIKRPLRACITLFRLQSGTMQYSHKSGNFTPFLPLHVFYPHAVQNRGTGTNTAQLGCRPGFQSSLLSGKSPVY